MRKFKKKN